MSRVCTPVQLSATESSNNVTLALAAWAAKKLPSVSQPTAAAKAIWKPPLPRKQLSARPSRDSPINVFDNDPPADTWMNGNIQHYIHCENQIPVPLHRIAKILHTKLLWLYKTCQASPYTCLIGCIFQSLQDLSTLLCRYHSAAALTVDTVVATLTLCFDIHAQRHPIPSASLHNAKPH